MGMIINAYKSSESNLTERDLLQKLRAGV